MAEAKPEKAKMVENILSQMVGLLSGKLTDTQLIFSFEQVSEQTKCPTTVKFNGGMMFIDSDNSPFPCLFFFYECFYGAFPIHLFLVNLISYKLILVQKGQESFILIK